MSDDSSSSSSGLSAAERRERRKKKILENAEQRISTILKGPDGTENRQAPVIDGEPTSLAFSEDSARTIPFEDNEEAPKKTQTLPMITPCFDFIEQHRFTISACTGILLRILVEFGLLTNVVWPWLVAAFTYELCAYQQKRVRYPKHGNALNLMLVSGLSEELVLILAAFGFLFIHGVIAFAKRFNEEFL